MRLDRDPALPFQIHRIEQLILLVALVNSARAFEQPIRQCGLAVIDVRDDAEIAGQLDRHEAALCGRGPSRSIEPQALRRAVSTDTNALMPRLIIRSAETGPVTHELTEESITIGRAPENMIVLEDASVSGHHAQLQRSGDVYRIKDLGSTNGTRVNSENVTEVTLRFGDRLRFGKLEARFEADLVGGAEPLPEVAPIEAQPAEMSVRPADFANASPFRAARKRWTRCARQFSPPRA